MTDRLTREREQEIERLLRTREQWYREGCPHMDDGGSYARNEHMVLASDAADDLAQALRLIDALRRDAAQARGLFWPHNNEFDAHIYEIRNGKNADYVREHAKALAEEQASADRARLQAVETAATRTLAQLRHMYAQVFRIPTKHASDFATGLIAPEIRRLEAALLHAQADAATPKVRRDVETPKEHK